MLRKSRFSEFLIKHNHLDKSGFEQWVFCSGMLFHDQDTWWENGRIRKRPHEGLDFCFYRDKDGQDHRLDEKTKIPVMYEGEIIRIDDDFLGQSLFVGHDIYDDHGNRLHTIYGHTNPYRGVTVGKIFVEGDAIASIADMKGEKTKIFPHLHISVAWLPKSFPYKELNWEIIGNSQAIILCDPLEFIDSKYKVERGVLRREAMRITEK